MKLTVLERIILRGILPENGNYINFKILADLHKELAFSEKEIKDWEIKEVPQEGDKNFVSWNPDKAHEKEIKLGEVARNIVVAELKKLDEKEGITPQNVTLYEKFLMK